MKIVFTLILSTFLVAMLLLLIHMTEAAPRDVDPGCGRSIPPACAEMGACVYNFEDCTYEMLE